MKTERLVHRLALFIITALLAHGSLRAEENGTMNNQDSEKHNISSGTDWNLNYRPSEISHSELIESIKSFNRGNNHQIVDSESSSSFPAIDRMILGFQQHPPRSVKLEEGTQILWGWQDGQAWVQSIAIFDGDNELKLVGFADNIPRIFSWRSKSGLKSLNEYESLLAKRRSTYLGAPAITLFADNQADVDRYYKFVVRWAQADLLGFNSKCGNPTYAESCTLAGKITIPTTILTTKCSAQNTPDSTCILRIPKSNPNDVPLDIFRQ
ncbi:hypothetical protein C4K14_4076 [Pseudomonas chlororaphis subsp. aureofaciens]|uniref:hypothetical protein n=1 Tax=Pseudomonas chlororaphis TaxID=587753 RepID=UPI000F564A93|nr:hypothetical protein [Pseudomonas chlororaphis]AZD86898.1 hypothetical protein C4K14_4076 [Pseudomonas chlororaphis subsp. aureofaciens]